MQYGQRRMSVSLLEMKVMSASSTSVTSFNAFTFHQRQTVVTLMKFVKIFEPMSDIYASRDKTRLASNVIWTGLEPTAFKDLVNKRTFVNVVADRHVRKMKKGLLAQQCALCSFLYRKNLRRWMIHYFGIFIFRVDVCILFYASVRQSASTKV